MNKLQYYLFLSLIILSCQDNKESRKKNKSLFSIIEKSITQKDKKIKDTITYTITNLPGDRSAFVTCIFDIYNSKRILNRDPIMEIFERRSKNKKQETLLKGIYYSIADNSDVMYADFNFDGKMDFAFTSEPSGYRNFYHYIFYLATDNGYKLNKDFSQIMEEPISFLDLDENTKKIYAYREAEFYQSWEYVVEGNKPKLVKITNKNLEGQLLSEEK